jgi:hypothetical protein
LGGGGRASLCLFPSSGTPGHHHPELTPTPQLLAVPQSSALPSFPPSVSWNRDQQGAPQDPRHVTQSVSPGSPYRTESETWTSYILKPLFPPSPGPVLLHEQGEEYQAGLPDWRCKSLTYGGVPNPVLGTSYPRSPFLSCCHTPGKISRWWYWDLNSGTLPPEPCPQSSLLKIYFT